MRSRKAYVRAERFNQPIFGANNLTGTVFQVGCCCALSLGRSTADGRALPQVGGPDGGPAGGLPPHAFAIYFREVRAYRRAEVAAAQSLTCAAGRVWDVFAAVLSVLAARPRGGAVADGGPTRRDARDAGHALVGVFGPKRPDRAVCS